MKRLHVHVGVPNLEQSVRFYSTLFGAEPSVLHQDYAKWLLDDPCVNFAISTRTDKFGVDHLGVQTDGRCELDAISARLKDAHEQTFDQEATTCCYAVSDKSWVEDPAGLRWENFFTHGEATVYGADASREETAFQDGTNSPRACCG